MRYLSLFLFLCSCSLVDQRLNPDVVYRRDIEVNINGVDFEGTGVPARAEKYDMVIKSPGTISMFTVTTCHRVVQFEPQTSLFKRGDTVKWSYVPTKGIEDLKGCMMEIGVFDAKHGKHGWAAIDFMNGFETVPATLQCDGQTRAVGPVSICQAQSGLVQKIIFDRRMKVAPDRDECKVFRTVDEKMYTFQMPENTECTYYFGSKEGEFHRLTLIGFSSLLVRDL